MNPEELLSIIGIYEAEIVYLYEQFDEGKISKEEYTEKIKEPHEAQMKIVDIFTKEVLTDFLDFLLKNGYCDSDVYSEPPTAIDQYLIFNKKNP